MEGETGERQEVERSMIVKGRTKSRKERDIRGCKGRKEKRMADDSLFCRVVAEGPNMMT